MSAEIKLNEIDLIIAKHQQLLNAKKIQGSMTEPDRVVDDNQTIISANDHFLEMFGIPRDLIIKKDN